MLTLPYLQRQRAKVELNRYLFCCGGTAVLRLLDAQPDVVRALSLSEVPLLYEHTPVGTNLVPPVGVQAVDLTDPDATLAALDASGYSHLIISRRYLSPGWEWSQLVNEDFLRRYTVLVGNGPDSYLYRILPPAERATPVPWTTGPELLNNGSFELTDANGGPTYRTPMTVAVGTPAAARASTAAPHDDGNGAATTGEAAVLIGRGEGWSTTVPVRPGQRYLLAAASRGAAAEGNGDTSFVLRLEWRDTAGHTIGIATSRVPTSAGGYHRFSLAASAPPGTTTATVVLLAVDAGVWVDDVSLREATGGVDLGVDP